MKSAGDYYEYVGGKWASAGKFALKVPAGKYVVEVQPYPNGSISSGSPVRTRLSTCEVPASGSVVCDVALSTGNLFGEIITPAGDIVNYAGVYTVKKVKKLLPKTSIVQQMLKSRQNMQNNSQKLNS